MSTLWIWIVLAILTAIVAVYRLATRRARPSRPPVVDDETIDRILRDGTVSDMEEEPLDEDEIARAEEEFWEESWDDPEEYGR